MEYKQDKYKIIHAEITSYCRQIKSNFVRVYYKKFRGRKIYSCQLTEADLKNNTIPEWFGIILR